LKRFAAPLVLILLASSAQASGIALRWNSCQGTANRSFACDRSTGSELLVGSFSPPNGVSQLSGIEVILSFGAADGTLPSWWQMFDVGSCRRGAISSSFDMSDQTECDDAWNGAATGGMVDAAQTLVSRYDVGNPSGIEMCIAAAVPPSMIQPVSSGRQYAAFKLIINHSKTNGACAGCDVPMCITIDALRLTQPGKPQSDGNPGTENYVDMTDGISTMSGQSQVATWQGGTSSCGAGSSKASTWSQLKARFKGN
jgi:hypothetical protein